LNTFLNNLGRWAEESGWCYNDEKPGARFEGGGLKKKLQQKLKVESWRLFKTVTLVVAKHNFHRVTFNQDF
jgi:hypothetical protein